MFNVYEFDKRQLDYSQGQKKELVMNMRMKKIKGKLFIIAKFFRTQF